MIRTTVGPMFSGKSDHLIGVYTKIWNKNIVMAFKPSNDSRDGLFIKSKNYKDIAIPAIGITSLDEIRAKVLESNARTVFIDEAQFLEGDVSVLVDLSVLYDIDFYIAGLNMTSEQIPFPMMSSILGVSDEVEIISGFCQDCNKPSVYSFSQNDDKTEMVHVGDDYVSLCPACLKRRRLDRQKRLSLRGEKK